MRAHLCHVPSLKHDVITGLIFQYSCLVSFDGFTVWGLRVKMGSLFRSEKMTLAQLFLQSEAAYACIRELGELVRNTHNHLLTMCHY